MLGFLKCEDFDLRGKVLVTDTEEGLCWSWTQIFQFQCILFKYCELVDLRWVKIVVKTYLESKKDDFPVSTSFILKCVDTFDSSGKGLIYLFFSKIV